MSELTSLLSRHAKDRLAGVSLLPDAEELSLARTRVHEATGPARHAFAVWLAARTQGPVFWIAAEWQQERLNSDGISPWLDPGRILFVTPGRREDLLWTMEEVLRSGAAALSIVDLPALPALTPVRRMHLAAQTGAETGPQTPLGLILTPGQGGAAGVETRWHLEPRHAEGAAHWQLSRVRARTAPLKNWMIHYGADAGHFQIKPA